MLALWLGIPEDREIRTEIQKHMFQSALLCSGHHKGQQTALPTGEAEHLFAARLLGLWAAWEERRGGEGKGEALPHTAASSNIRKAINCRMETKA